MFLGSVRGGLSEAEPPRRGRAQAGSLIDLDLVRHLRCPARRSVPSALQAAEAALKAKPDDLNARFGRATAYFQLGENQKAIDDLKS